jgi:hypothetical protein
VRAEHLRPSFAPIIGLAALPLASALVGVAGLRRGRPAPRGWHAALLAAAVLELAWAVVAAAVIGWAIAWQSG